MIANYTVVYLILLMLTSFIPLVLPGLQTINTIIREMYIVFLFIVFVLQRVKYKNINKLKQEYLYLIIFFAVNIYSFIISPNQSDSFTSFVLYISGPLIFLLIAHIKISHIQYNQYQNKIQKVLLLFILGAIIIYPMQERIYSQLFNFHEFDTRAVFYVWNNIGYMTNEMRLSGFSIHPAITASIIYFFSINLYYFGNKKKLVFYSAIYYLTKTRALLTGLIFYKILKLNIVYKALFTGIAVMFLYILVNEKWIHQYIDPSGMKHLLDIAVYGPKHLVSNISAFGQGHGTVKPFSTETSFSYSVESDLYIGIVQIGLVGMISYIYAIVKIMKKLLKTTRTSKNLAPLARYVLIIFISLNIGCIFFSYYATRFVSNFVWIELGLFYSIVYNGNVKIQPEK